MNREEIGKLIWERFAFVERSRDDFEAIHFPNRELMEWRKFFLNNFQGNRGDLIMEDLAYKRFVTPEVFRDDKKVIRLVDSVPDYEVNLMELTNQLPKKEVIKGIRRFVAETDFVIGSDRSPRMNVIIPSGNFDVVISFNVRSGYFQSTDYLVKVFNAGGVRKIGGMVFAFVEGYLWGCGSSTWDGLLSKEILHDALKELFGQCVRLAEVFSEIEISE